MMLFSFMVLFHQYSLVKADETESTLTQKYFKLYADMTGKWDEKDGFIYRYSEKDNHAVIVTMNMDKKVITWVRAPSGSHRNKARRRQKEKSPTISMYCGTFFMFPSYLKVPKGYEKKSWTSKQWYNWYSGYSASSASHTCAYVHYFITRTLFIYMRV